ncbi:MAG: molybdopterin-guanine dinucleotide biosynthesis protein B [Anaerolineaceae bacterium]|nr:molybdopterin-guanine dinucleotide biosynthesis protein B [Anaerolineaceae bacterium]
MKKMESLFQKSAERHSNLCPKQILGIRMGLYGGKLLGLEVPREKDKILFVFAEADGCGTGGLSVATNSWPDRRNMRIMDFGLQAATFVNTETMQAVRLHPDPDNRQRAWQYAPQAKDHWHAMFEAYKIMPDEEMFIVEHVEITADLQAIISQPGLRINCDKCGEEISNAREVILPEKVLCRSCAGESYYKISEQIIKTRISCNGSKQTSPIPLVTVIGKSGSGKTTLLEKLILEISSRGYRLATVKHHSHAGFDIDVPGKDSWRLAQAGSQHVTIAAPDRIARYFNLENELSLEEITTDITNVDLILVEGYKQANKPSIEIIRAENSREIIGGPEQRIAIATDFDLDLGVPKFGLEEIENLADFIEKQYLDKT